MQLYRRLMLMALVTNFKREADKTFSTPSWHFEFSCRRSLSLHLLLNAANPHWTESARAFDTPMSSAAELSQRHSSRSHKDIAGLAEPFRRWNRSTAAMVRAPFAVRVAARAHEATAKRSTTRLDSNISRSSTEFRSPATWCNRFVHRSATLVADSVASHQTAAYSDRSVPASSCRSQPSDDDFRAGTGFAVRHDCSWASMWARWGWFERALATSSPAFPLHSRNSFGGWCSTNSRLR